MRLVILALALVGCASAPAFPCPSDGGYEPICPDGTSGWCGTYDDVGFLRETPALCVDGEPFCPPPAGLVPACD